MQKRSKFVRERYKQKKSCREKGNRRERQKKRKIEIEKDRKRESQKKRKIEKEKEGKREIERKRERESERERKRVNFSFILPFISFLVIAIYGYRTLKVHK